MRLEVTGLEIGLSGMPAVTIGGARATVAFASSRAAHADRARRASKADAWPIALESAPGGTALPRRRAEAGHRLPSGGQPRRRPRRPHLRHLQRSARAAVERVDLSRRRRRRARCVRHRHHQRDVDGLRSRRAGCTSRAGSTARSRASTSRARRRSSRATSGWRCGLAFDGDGVLFVGRPIGHDLPARAGGRADGVRVAAVERRRVSPRLEPDGRGST